MKWTYKFLLHMDTKPFSVKTSDFIEAGLDSEVTTEHFERWKLEQKNAFRLALFWP